MKLSSHLLICQDIISEGLEINSAEKMDNIIVSCCKLACIYFSLSCIQEVKVEVEGRKYTLSDGPIHPSRQYVGKNKAMEGSGF